jgi:hypothetical protein
MQETDKRPPRQKNYFVLSDLSIVAQAQNWRDDPEQMLKDLGACVDRVQESVTLTEDYKILPPFDPDTLSHLDLRQDIERASQTLRIVDPTCLLLRELAIAFGKLRLEISGTEALPSGVLESLFSRIAGGLRELRLLQEASAQTKTPRPNLTDGWSDPYTVKNWMSRLDMQKTTWGRRREAFPEAFKDIPGSNMCLIRLDYLELWDLEAKAKRPPS